MTMHCSHQSLFHQQLTGVYLGFTKLGLESQLGGVLDDQRASQFLQIPFPTRLSGEEMWSCIPFESLMIALELRP